MSKVFRHLPNKAGFSIIEIVLSTALFLIFSTGMVLLILQSLTVEQESAEYLVATSYAREGIESVNFIRQAGYSSLGTLSEGDIEKNDEAGLRFLYGPNTYEIYQRKITVTDIDSTSKRIDVTVTWPLTSENQHAVTLTGYLFNWQQSY